MIGDLPVEIQTRILSQCPTSSLKLINSHFYVIYNGLFYEKIIASFGEAIIGVLQKVLPWLRSYIKSLDVKRFRCRDLLATKLGLQDIDPDHLNVRFVADSWKYVYSLIKNKRLFAEYADYKIDEPTNYIFNHYVEINRTYLLTYCKYLWLAPGDYNLNIGLVVKHGNGLGTTKFEVSYDDADGQVVHQLFYAPTNINDILPKQQFCLLKLGEFHIPDPNERKQIGDKQLNDEAIEVDENSYPRASCDNNLIRVKLIMEEIGLYVKSGFRIFFIDVSQPSLLFNDYDLLYYTVKETDYRYFINIPLKNFYKALDYVQNGGVPKEQDQSREAAARYGLGNPNDVTNYELEFSIPEQDHDGYRVDSGDCDDGTSTKTTDLMMYSNFFFLNRFGKRFFKFSTIYQRRQFVNTFGDFEIDWNDDSVKGNGDRKKACQYDPDGLKWKMPILGEY